MSVNQPGMAGVEFELPIGFYIKQVKETKRKKEGGFASDVAVGKSCAACPLLEEEPFSRGRKRCFMLSV